MKFGSIVWLRRGSIDRQTGVGRARFTKALYRGARGHNVYCELLEDDPDAFSLRRMGDVGWWSRSAMRKYTDERPVADAGNYLQK